MTQIGLTWQELLDSLAERLGEPDLFNMADGAEGNTPYFDPSIVEQFLYYASLYYVRIAPVAILQDLGGEAIKVITGGIIVGGLDLPQNAVRPLWARNKIQSTGSPWTGCDFVDPARYEQLISVGAQETSFYTVYAGKAWINQGFGLEVTYLAEPTIDIFQNDTPVLPGSYDEDRIDRAHKFLMLTDNLSTGNL